MTDSICHSRPTLLTVEVQIVDNFFILAILFKQAMEGNVTHRDPHSREFAGTGEEQVRFLVLHNDEVNTFNHVINSLIQVCGHDSVQAEQCAFITHYKGKCEIKSGEMSILAPMKEGLNERGLLVSID